MAIFVQFQSSSEEAIGDVISLETDLTLHDLNEVVNKLYEGDEKQEFAFFVGEEELRGPQPLLSLKDQTESTVVIHCRPTALFTVAPVARCVADMPGHKDAVLSLAFSPDCKQLASGSGDLTIRIWDTYTATCKQVLSGHKNWILCVRYSPNGRFLASASHDGEIRIWDISGNGINNSSKERIIRAHSKWVNCITWVPFHIDPESRYLASGGKDGLVRIWDAVNGNCVKTLLSAEKAVTDIAWCGTVENTEDDKSTGKLGTIICSSEDCSIRTYAAGGSWKQTGKIMSHAHWVNSIAVNTQHVLEQGICSFINEIRAKKQSYIKIVQKYQPLITASKSHYTCNASPIDKTTGLRVKTEEELREELNVELARLKYSEVLELSGHKTEIFATCSDDQTICLFKLGESKPYARLTGHAKPINHVIFSPDGNYLASASFDKTVIVWNVKTGKMYCKYRNHVGDVYRIAFSADSRLIMSASKDSTAKVFSVPKKQMVRDLPGHSDAVYCVVWANDGSMAATAGKDRVVKMWKN